MSISKNITAVLPALEPGLLEELAQVAEIREFPAGETLMRQGQYFRSTMIILKGLVKIYREDEEGNEFFMYHLGPGKACALSMICALKQEQSEILAKAVTDTEVLSIPLKKMDEWMTRYKSWSQYVLGSYRERFEELLETIDHVAFRNMDERIIFYLKKHRETLKTDTIPVTHSEIAQELNSSREVITRLLKKLAERGLIRIHRNSIEILNLDRVA
jgi:CRP/FNR family transcriptional regulator, anaerobic regulatory protein